MPLAALTRLRQLFKTVTAPIASRLNLDEIDRYWNYPRSGNTYLESYHDARRISGSTDDLAKQLRFYTLMQAVEQILSRQVPGDVVECGCWRGHSTHMIASRLEKSAWPGRFLVFDSFAGGLSDKCAIDRTQQGNTSSKQTLEQKNLFASDKDKVADVLSPFPFVELQMGWIPEVFAQVPDLLTRRFALVHVDVDLYEPTLATLRLFAPRMAKGGIIVVDDYASSHFPGATVAVDAYIKEHQPVLSIAGQTGGMLLLY